MKVLHVVPSIDLRLGGVSKVVITLSEALVAFGKESEIVCLDEVDPEFIKKSKINVVSLGPASGPWRYSAKLIPWLQQNIQRFDTVILHGLWLFHGYGVWKVLNQIKNNKSNVEKKVPQLLLMPHGMLDPYFQKAKERRLKAIRNWIVWKLIENKVVNTANGLLFTCETELLLARTTFKGYHPKAEFNVGYGIDLPPAKNQKMKSAFLALCPDLKNKPYLLFLSRIHQKKGVDLLIKAYKKLQEESPLNKALPKLVIAGPGLDTSYGKAMLALVDDVSLKKEVYFTGMLDGDAKWGAFYGCEAFVLPSHQENFGIAVAESLACSKPVILSTKVNIWKEVEMGNGGIIGKDTLEGVLIMLKEWLEMDHDSRIVMESNANQVYLNYFTIQKTAEKISKIIDEI